MAVERCKQHVWVKARDIRGGRWFRRCANCGLPLVGYLWWRRKAIIFTHVLILRVPNCHRDEAGQHEGKLYPVDRLPEGFTIVGSPNWDWWLKYKDDGTVETACAREFFQRLPGGRWRRYPFFDDKSPEEALEEHRANEARMAAIRAELGAQTEPGH